MQPTTQPRAKLTAPPDSELLKEAAALVSGILGKQYAFNSRGLFHRWFVTQGMNKLVAAGAMNPINNDEWSSLEQVVAMLRHAGT